MTAGIGAIFAGITLSSILGLVNGILDFVNHLPKVLSIAVYLMLFVVIMTFLGAVISVFNNLSPIDVPVCITNETFRNIPSMSTRWQSVNNTDRYAELCSGVHGEFLSPVDCILLKVHPSCGSCVASGWMNDTLCKGSMNLSVGPIYSTTWMISLPPNVSSDSCYYAANKGDVRVIWDDYMFCSNHFGSGVPIETPTPFGVAFRWTLVPKCFASMGVDIENRIKEIANEGHEYGPKASVKDETKTDQTIIDQVFGLFTPQPCSGIYLLDTQKWAAIAILSYLVVFSLSYYNSIWQFIIKR